VHQGTRANPKVGLRDYKQSGNRLIVNTRTRLIKSVLI